jgi:hypothetical protein
VSGLRVLIDSISGLRVKDMWFDTSALEFYGSELARSRVPLFDRTTGAATDPVRHFGKAQVDAWQRRASEYNRRGEAGTAAFLIQKN